MLVSKGTIPICYYKMSSPLTFQESSFKKIDLQIIFLV